MVACDTNEDKKSSKSINGQLELINNNNNLKVSFLHSDFYLCKSE